ncbi:MAG: hypothetical protein IPJ98_22595 [Bryobacterales bacterium]|nr:hypothetical protein [Bryobacterales bacterium]
MKRLLLAFAACGALAFAQYKVEATGEAPAEVAAPIKEMLAPAGHKVMSGDGKVWCEVWFVKAAPKGPDSTEADLMWKTAPPGSVIGAIRWHEGGYDRRGQVLKPGVYTLRFSMFPLNGDHQGVAPNRDFLVMTPAADDQSAAAVPKFDDLMKMSRKASGTPHPAVLAMYVVESDFQPGLQNVGEDWNLFAKVGETPIGLTVVGKSEH